MATISRLANQPLGHCVRRKRGSSVRTEVAPNLGIPRSTFAGTKRCASEPSVAAAFKLAKRLCRSVEAEGQLPPEGPICRYVRNAAVADS